ncbi:mitochondrial ribosomal protein L37-domain-containing protein [Gorgonomyces haynaldii]|nr:mitochondrial ribosomal protein L37-domain-containing protein [Gorgonomyces haynaldii]
MLLRRWKSIAPKGTVLKGINILKTGKDPVALDDSEYPEWLWTIGEKTYTNEYSIKHLRTLTKEKIKTNALKK